MRSKQVEQVAGRMTLQILGSCKPDHGKHKHHRSRLFNVVVRLSLLWYWWWVGLSLGLY